MAENAVVRVVIRDVIGIAYSFIVGLMACVAVGGCAGELSGNVALLALERKMSAGQWERCQIVIERRGTPNGCGMTNPAVMWKFAGHVIRISYLLEVGSVTIIALRRRPGELTAHVTLLAIQRCVGSVQRKVAQIVIEGRRPPGGCRMTLGAGKWKFGGSMIGIGGRVIIAAMARNAFR